MSHRTYVPTLLFLLKQVCTFIARHRTRILDTIGVEHTTKLDAIVLACDIFTAVADDFLETPL